MPGPIARARESCWTPAPRARPSWRKGPRSNSPGWSGPDRPRPYWSCTTAAPTRPCGWGRSRLRSSRTSRASPTIHEPSTTAARALGLYLDGAHPLDAFGGDSGRGDTWTAFDEPGPLRRLLRRDGRRGARVPRRPVRSTRPRRPGGRGRRRPRPAGSAPPRPRATGVLTLAGALVRRPLAAAGLASPRFGRGGEAGAGPARRPGPRRGLGLSPAPPRRPGGDASPGGRGPDPRPDRTGAGIPAPPPAW